MSCLPFMPQVLTDGAWNMFVLFSKRENENFNQIHSKCFCPSSFL